MFNLLFEQKAPVIVLPIPEPLFHICFPAIVSPKKTQTHTRASTPRIGASPLWGTALPTSPGRSIHPAAWINSIINHFIFFFSLLLRPCWAEKVFLKIKPIKAHWVIQHESSVGCCWIMRFASSFPTVLLSGECTVSLWVAFSPPQVRPNCLSVTSKRLLVMTEVLVLPVWHGSIRGTSQMDIAYKHKIHP